MSNVTVLGQIQVAPGNNCKVTKCNSTAITSLKMRVYEQELEVPVCEYHHKVAMRPDSLNPRYIIGVELKGQRQRPPITPAYHPPQQMSAHYTVTQRRVVKHPDADKPAWKQGSGVQEWPQASLPEAGPTDRVSRHKRSRHASPGGGKKHGTTPHERDQFKFERRKKRDAYKRQKGGWNA